MVEAIGTNVVIQAQSVAAAEQTAPRSVQQHVNRPDAPTRVAVSPTTVGFRAKALSATSTTGLAETESESAPRPAVTPLISDSGLTTYRDQESGRLIVRVFDRESGDVLLEFPPEGQRQALKVFEPPGSGASKTQHSA